MEALQMRWFSIRKAKIDPELRKTFERYGAVGMQIALSDMNHFIHQGRTDNESRRGFGFRFGLAH
jgi:hypothetical protein